MNWQEVAPGEIAVVQAAILNADGDLANAIMGLFNYACACNACKRQASTAILRTWSQHITQSVPPRLNPDYLIRITTELAATPAAQSSITHDNALRLINKVEGDATKSVLSTPWFWMFILVVLAWAAFSFLSRN